MRRIPYKDAAIGSEPRAFRRVDYGCYRFSVAIGEYVDDGGTVEGVYTMRLPRDVNDKSTCWKVIRAFNTERLLLEPATAM